MTENMVWCAECGADGTLARAVAELPCTNCGKTNWFIATNDRDSLLDLSERMQCIGCWEVAETALIRCRELDLISQADFNLTHCALEVRHECADAAVELVEAAESIDMATLRDVLTEQFDPFTVHWLFTKYKGLPFEVRHAT